MFARLEAACEQLAASDPPARRWFTLVSTFALSIFEPAPWRAVQAAEACLRDARAAGDRFVEQWLLVAGNELRWWKLGDAAAEGRLRGHLQAAIQTGNVTLHAACAIQLARIACDTGDPAALHEAAQWMRVIAEDPRGAAFGNGLAYEHWARIELRRGRPAAALAERGRAALGFAPLYALGITATLCRALAVAGRIEDAVRVAGEGLAVVEARGCAGDLEVEMRLAATEAWLAAGEMERARGELGTTLAQIRVRAEDIDDPGWRRSYLTRNAEHRCARELAVALGVPDPTAALLAGP
jgi:hypothetical protein